jgi:hypothetical protein
MCAIPTDLSDFDSLSVQIFLVFPGLMLLRRLSFLCCCLVQTPPLLVRFLVLVFPSRSAPGSSVFWSGVCPAVWACCLRELLTAGSVLPRLIAVCVSRSRERGAQSRPPASLFFSSGSSRSHRSAHQDLFSAWQSVHGFGFDVEFLW